MSNAEGGPADEPSWSRELGDRLEAIEDAPPRFLQELAKPRPDVVFQYAAPSALLGMLTSGSLWATNALFLNDRSELFYVNDVIAAAAASLRAEATTKAGRELIETLCQPKWRELEPRDVFVACFSAKEDSLSQWRAYADDGRGYAVGIDASVPYHVKDRPEVRASLIQVFYGEGPQELLIREPLGRILSAVDQAPGTADPQSVQFRALVAVLAAVVPLGVALKNPGFDEEWEWRLVVVNNAPWPQGPHMRYRPSQFGFTPYVELVPEGGRLPLRKVVLGPQLHDDPSRRALVDVLLHHQYKVSPQDAQDTVRIANSKATYRGREGR